jgi:hypothetical protein
MSMSSPVDCPSCGQPRAERDRYCERCGHDERSSGAPVWEIEVAADHEQFVRIAPPDLAWPEGRTSVVVALDDDEVRVGRDRAGAVVLNLDGSIADPGVSRHHCTFERQEDGGFGVRDAGSTNGTSINDDPTPITPFTLVRLVDGDRVHVGAWTALHYRRAGSA